MFIVRVLVLDSLSECRIEGTGIVGTRTVPVPENGEPNIQGIREQERFLFQEVGNQMYMVLERNGSSTQVL